MNSIVLYLSTVLIWGSTWYAIKLQLGAVEPMVSVGYRFALAAIILMAWCHIRQLPMRYSLRDHTGMALLGLFLFSTNYVVFYEASVFITTGLVAVTFSTIIVMNIINGAIFLGNRISVATVVGAITGICGIILVFLPDFKSFDSVGIVLCATGTLLASFGNIVSANNQKRGVPVIQANAWGMSYGAIFLLIAIVYQGHEFAFEWSIDYVGSLLYLAIFGSILAFGSYLTLIGRVGPEKAAYATVVFPIVALLISTWLEDYRWSWIALTGVFLVLGGNMLVTRVNQKS